MSKVNDKALSNGCGSSNGCGASNSCSSKPAKNNTPNTKSPLELHACMGLNACRGHDRFGSNTCAGTGSCATQAHVCHTLNNCAGQGGCGLFGDADEQCKPGANDCSWQGSCATPIQAERFSTLGANKNRSVWLLARELFEQRMEKSRRNVGPSPFPAGPPQAWLESFGEYDSCGNSGDKSCSFGFNSPSKNTQELVNRSKEPRPEEQQKCDCNNKLNKD